MRILIIFLILFTGNAYSQTFCDALSTEIKNNQIKERLDLAPLDFEGQNSLGINLDYSYDSENEEWLIKRDKAGNPIVFNTLINNGEGKTFESSEFFSFGDRLISIDGQKLNVLKKDEVLNLLEPETSVINDEAKKYRVEYIKSDSFNDETSFVEIGSLYDGQIRVWPTVIIDNFIEIFPKTNKFKIAYTFEYRWDDYEIASIIESLRSKYKISSYDETIGNCQYSVKQFKSLGLWYPQLSFQNRVEESSDMVEEYFEIHNYPEGNLYEGESTPISEMIYWSKGTALFQGDFNFKAFPLDRQVINLKLFADADEIPINDTWLFLEWDDYLTKNLKLLNWDIKEASIVPDKWNDVYWNEDKTIYNLNISIDRNYLYFIFKVYLPAYIIIFLAFMSLYIHPKNVEARLTVTIVSFLSLTAYTYIIDQDLPKLGYTTLIDGFTIVLYLLAAWPTAISILTSYNFTYHKLKWSFHSTNSTQIPKDVFDEKEELRSFRGSYKVELVMLSMIAILFPLLCLMAVQVVRNDPSLSSYNWITILLGFLAPFSAIYILMAYKLIKLRFYFRGIKV